MSAAALGLPVAALIAGLVVAAFIVAAGLQLFANAAEADRHLKAGSALVPPTRPARATGAPAAAGARTAGVGFVDGGGVADEPDTYVSALLSTYYAANLSRAATIFWASLLAMSIGFAIVFAGVLAAGTNGVTAVAAAIAGILGQFIAATFLVVLRSTQEQGTSFVQTLVELRLRDLTRAADARAVDLGLRLLAEISADRTDPANPTKATIAAGLIVKTPPTLVEPPAVTVSAPIEPVSERRTRTGIVTFDEAAPAAPTEPVR